MVKKLNIDAEALVRAMIPAITESVTKSVAKALIGIMELAEPEEIVEARYEGYIPTEAVKTFKDPADFPMILAPKDVEAMLGVSQSKAYQLMNHHDCPCNPLYGKLRVHKDDFLNWLASHNTTVGKMKEAEGGDCE